MNKLLRITVLLAGASTLAACEATYNANRPGDLVPTDTFVSNVLEEHGVIRRQNTRPIPGVNSTTEDEPTS